MPDTNTGTKPFSGWRYALIRTAIAVNVMLLALVRYKSIAKAISILKKMRTRAKENKYIFNRTFRNGNKFYGNLSIQGWPSKSFSRYIQYTFDHIDGSNVSLHMAIFAITHSCGFKCQHCVEWDTLNNKDSLSADNILSIIQKLHNAGVTQILFSGGEPLSRIKDLGEILNKAPRDIDYWMFTNGYSMTEKKARFLKAHGLTGVIVSLDSASPAYHDQFRGVPGSFGRAINAIRFVNEAGMLSAISCCATNEFVSRKNLREYIELARSQSVSFVQFLEPEAAGRYRHQDVLLTSENQAILESLHNEVNFSSAYRDYPLITYYPYLKRLNGCVARGINFLYIDAEGDVHACPFCRSKRFSILKEDLPSNLEELRNVSCSSFSLHKNVNTLNVRIHTVQDLPGVSVQFPQPEKYHI